MYHLIHEHSIGDTSPLFQGSCWFIFLSPKRRKRFWVFRNKSKKAGEGRTIFLTVMVLRFIYKALKETDLTQYLQLNLTRIIEKDTS